MHLHVVYDCIMERLVDKLLITLAAGVFLACNLHAEHLMLSAVDIAVVLGMVLFAAVSELVRERARAVLCVAACVLALFSAAGAPFLALTLYDCVRDLYGQRAFRWVLAFPLSALVFMAVLNTASPFFELSSAACMMFAALVSFRTGRMLSRVATITRTRDEAARANLYLHEKNASLEGELVLATAKLQEQTAPDVRVANLDPLGRPDAFLCLTEREFEVARLVADGMDNKEIAATAYMSEGTVRNHISSCLTKLALKNRTQLALEYWRNVGGF